MKFESKIGIGEIVIIGSEIEKRRDKGTDYLGKVIAVLFDHDGPAYVVDMQVPTGVQRMQFRDAELEGDPTFDQAAGAYPEE